MGRGAWVTTSFLAERERDNSTSGTTHASAQSAPALVGDGGGSATGGAQEVMLPPSPPSSESEFLFDSFSGAHQTRPNRRETLVYEHDMPISLDSERMQVADALSQQADHLFLWIIDDTSAFVGRDFRKHQDNLNRDGEPVGMVSALVFIRSLTSSAMRETNMHNSIKKSLDEYMLTSGCTDF